VTFDDKGSSAVAMALDDLKQRFRDVGKARDCFIS
jgi:hypothetical protein